MKILFNFSLIVVSFSALAAELGSSKRLITVTAQNFVRAKALADSLLDTSAAGAQIEQAEIEKKKNSEQSALQNDATHLEAIKLQAKELAHEMIGWQAMINKWDTEEFYGMHSLGIEYTRSPLDRLLKRSENNNDPVDQLLKSMAIDLEETTGSISSEEAQKMRAATQKL